MNTAKFDNLICKEDRIHLNNSALDKLLSGATIIGAETVDYPCIDGYIFYLRYPDGQEAALCIEYDVVNESTCDANGDYLALSFAIAPGETKTPMAKALEKKKV